MSDNLHISVGDTIKYIIKKANLTQEDVAEILGIAQPTIALLLKSSAFGKRSATKWSEAFGFRINWLLTGEGDMFTSDHPKIFKYKGNSHNAEDLKIPDSDKNCLELEYGLLKQRILDLENVISTKDALIESLRETIRLMKNK